MSLSLPTRAQRIFQSHPKFSGTNRQEGENEINSPSLEALNNTPAPLQTRETEALAQQKPRKKLTFEDVDREVRTTLVSLSGSSALAGMLVGGSNPVFWPVFLGIFGLHTALRIQEHQKLVRQAQEEAMLASGVDPETVKHQTLFQILMNGSPIPPDDVQNVRNDEELFSMWSHISDEHHRLALDNAQQAHAHRDSDRKGKALLHLEESIKIKAVLWGPDSPQVTEERENLKTLKRQRL